MLPCFQPYSASLISRPAGWPSSDPRQRAIAPSPLPFSSPPHRSRSLARPSRWCHFLPRWNASCSGRRTDADGRANGQTNRNGFFSPFPPSLASRGHSLNSIVPSLPPSSFNNAFLSLVMHLVRRALADRHNDRQKTTTADVKYFVSVDGGDEIELLIERARN